MPERQANPFILESKKSQFRQMTTHDKNIPALRFKEFEGEWRNKKLDEVILRLDSGVSVNSIDEPVGNEDQFGILKTSCISSGNFYPKENKRIIDEDIARAKVNPVKDSILISRMNTPQLVGHSGIVGKDYPNLFVPDRLWMTSIDTKCTNPKLLSIILSSEKVMEMISNIATGTSGSMKNISKPNFLNLEIHIPSLPEQQKVASFLSAVDEKIQQLTRKKELLEQYKKGVMQQLFSGNLRFKGFEDEWKTKKYSELTTLVTNGFVGKAKDFYVDSNGITYIQGYNVIEGGFNLRGIKHVSLDFHKKNKKSNLIEGDLLTIQTGDIGVTTVVTKELAGSNCHALIISRFKPELASPYFYMSLFNSHRGRNQLKKIEKGSTMKHLNVGDIIGLIVPCPTLPEQNKIAGYLFSINTKIESVSNQIMQTQTFKKGLLQQMFV